MNVPGENNKEIYELFINKLSVTKMKLKISSLDASLERNASLQIIMKEFFVLDMNYLVL